LAKLGYSSEIAFKIISSILEKIPSALSYQAIARDIGISYKTVESYLEVFKYPKGVRILGEEEIPKFLIEVFSK